MSEPVAVGLAGAGPWAAMVHAPMLAAGPETTLAGVWARRPDAAAALAAQHGTTSFDRFGALLDACDAVAVAVPPDVQVDLAVAAARAGKAVLLEKPLALDLRGAEEIASAVDAAGVGSMVVLTYRFSSVVRDFLARARTFGAFGGRGCFLSGAFLGGSPFASSPWRRQHGALLDVGPHIVDLLDAALGPVTGVRAHGDPHGWVGLFLDHDGGAASEVSITSYAAIDSRTEVEVFGPKGTLVMDARAGDRSDKLAVMRREFAEVARTGAAHECDVHRGLHLQRVLAEATAQLA